jgi:hypothetical protein
MVTAIKAISIKNFGRRFAKLALRERLNRLSKAALAEN